MAFQYWAILTRDEKKTVHMDGLICIWTSYKEAESFRKLNMEGYDVVLCSYHFGGLVRKFGLGRFFVIETTPLEELAKPTPWRQKREGGNVLLVPSG